jgi:hypothetical protein
MIQAGAYRSAVTPYVNGAGVLRAPSGFSLPTASWELAHQLILFESDSLFFDYWIKFTGYRRLPIRSNSPIIQ